MFIFNYNIFVIQWENDIEQNKDNNLGGNSNMLCNI